MKHEMLNGKIRKTVNEKISDLNNLLKENGFENDYIHHKEDIEDSSFCRISTVISDNTPLTTKLSKILNVKIVDMKWDMFDEVTIVFE